MSAGIGTLLEAFEAGAAAGRRRDPVAAAFERGRAEGLTEGVLAGRAEGRADGREEGLEAGRAEGLEQGRAEGRRAAEEERDAALAAIAAGLAQIETARAETERRAAAMTASVMRAAVAALLPQLSRRGLADEVAAIAKDVCVGGALGEAALLVAPEQEEAMRDALESALNGQDQAPIELIADPTQSPLSARLDWRDGGVRFDAEEAAAQVIARLDAALQGEATPGREAGESGAPMVAEQLV